MKSPTLLTQSRVRIADVIEGHRLRPVTEAGVESLIASISETGVMKDAIHIRKKKDGTLHLVAGGHRLEAARRLGWEDIEAKVWSEVTDDWARLMEIDDNLAGAEMNPLDTAVFLAARKAVYERLHPESRAKTGAALAAVRWNAADIVSVASFARTTAEKFGLTDRHVRRMIAAGSALTPIEAKELRAAPRQITLKDLAELSKLSVSFERSAVIAALVDGRAKSASDARRQWKARDGSIETPTKDPVEEGVKAVLAVWARLPKKAKHRFLSEVEPEVSRLLREGREAAIINEKLGFGPDNAAGFEVLAKHAKRVGGKAE
jgi:ParB family chromosome partitioning protein